MKKTSTTLNKIINRDCIPNPNIIKIDTQGSELDILENCKNILHDCYFILSEIPAKNYQYNIGSPSYEEYINFYKNLGFSKHFTIDTKYDGMIEMQHDIVLLNDNIKRL